MLKFGGSSTGPMPAIAPTQALANMAGNVAGKLPEDFMDPVGQGPVPATQAPSPMPPTPPQAPVSMPPVARPTPPMAPANAAPTPTVMPQTPPSMPQMPQPEAPQMGGQYNDAARQQLYASLADKRKRNAAWAAVGGLGDMAARMGGGTPMNTQQTILAQGKQDDTTAREQFEAGRKGTREELADYLKQKIDARDFGLKEKELGLKHEEIKANREATRANKELTLSEKTGQFNDNKTRQFREEIMSGKPYQNYLTVHGMAKSVRMAASNPSAYGDLSSIYAMVKGLDPTSVVREGEIGLMREVTGLKDKLTSTLEKWGGNGPINAGMMKDIETVMGRLEGIAADNVRSHAAPTLNQARSMKLAENEIMGDLPTGQNPAQAPTASGSGMSPEQRRARIAQLRQQQGS